MLPILRWCDARSHCIVAGVHSGVVTNLSSGVCILGLYSDHKTWFVNPKTTAGCVASLSSFRIDSSSWAIVVVKQKLILLVLLVILLSWSHFESSFLTWVLNKTRIGFTTRDFFRLKSVSRWLALNSALNSTSSCAKLSQVYWYRLPNSSFCNTSAQLYVWYS